MSATAERVREIGFPWFDRHATRGSREIYQWTVNEFGSPNPFVPGPYITGTEWVSREAMRVYYRDVADGSRLRSRDCAGFIRYARPADEPFATWEEAEAWLFAPSGGDV